MGKLKEIMVVDDEAGIRALLSDALIAKGFSVTLAKNGKDSLNQLKKPFGIDQLIDTVNSALEPEGSQSKRRKNAA